MERDFDLVVIGSGPGGYVAAIRASQLGMRTCVIEKDPQFGGTCLHRGCVPTKAMLHSAALYDEVRRASRFGVIVEGSISFDGEKARSYRDGVVLKNARGLAQLLRKNDVETKHGRGRLRGPGVVEVSTGGESVQLRARYMLLATGSIPRELPHLATDGERILNSDHVLSMERVPESLVVVGGGAVGAEFASIYASLGTSVTLIEMLDHLLPAEDVDVSTELERVFRRRGIDVATAAILADVVYETEVTAASAEPVVRVTLRASGEGPALETRHLETECVLVAIGRQPVTGEIGLEELSIELDGAYVSVDAWMQTSAAGIYAIGDLVNTPLLAHVASAEGILAVEHMAGVAERPLDYDRVPSCTYCEPEVASVGLTEVEARRRGYEVETGRFPFSASGKASILGKTDGFAKVVRDSRYDELLGVHLIGAHATDLIAEACVALQIESTTEELVRTMHAHPTLSEAVAEAAQAALGRPTHI